MWKVGRKIDRARVLQYLYTDGILMMTIVIERLNCPEKCRLAGVAMGWNIFRGELLIMI